MVKDAHTGKSDSADRYWKLQGWWKCSPITSQKTEPHQTVTDFARTRTILKITLPKEKERPLHIQLYFVILNFYIL